MAIYMNYNGLKVKGNLTADGYKDWINVGSMQFGVGRGITMESGSMANREASRPSISEITISKTMDQSSPGLFKDSVTGDAGVKVIIDVVQTGAQKLEKFCSYELEQCLISSYTVSAGADGAPVETISLSFAKLMTSYTAADKANKAGSPTRVGYDLELGKPL